MKWNFPSSSLLLSVCVAATISLPGYAQSPPKPTAPPTSTTTSTTVQPLQLPKDYVVGVDDVLSIVFFRDKDMSAEVIVRPDGKISLPMLNDVAAAGMTPEQLAEAIEKAATKFVRDPDATVLVKDIRSRKVYVIGEVAKTGAMPLASEMTVMQALAEAGGPAEYANKGNIQIIRIEKGQERRIKFNYNDYVEGKNIQQNIRLLPGDTILVR